MMGEPVSVMRDKNECPQGVEAGVVMSVDTEHRPNCVRSRTIAVQSYCTRNHGNRGDSVSNCKPSQGIAHFIHRGACGRNLAKG
jgi:UDP-N-acetylglucosamine 2-epimerase